MISHELQGLAWVKQISPIISKYCISKEELKKTVIFVPSNDHLDMVISYLLMIMKTSQEKSVSFPFSYSVCFLPIPIGISILHITYTYFHSSIPTNIPKSYLFSERYSLELSLLLICPTLFSELIAISTACIL